MAKKKQKLELEGRPPTILHIENIQMRIESIRQLDEDEIHEDLWDQEEWEIDTLRAVTYSNMVYPQYEQYFRTIPETIWKDIQRQADENLDKCDHGSKIEGGHLSVHTHWVNISNGEVPFGFTVLPDEDYFKMMCRLTNDGSPPPYKFGTDKERRKQSNLN